MRVLQSGFMVVARSSFCGLTVMIAMTYQPRPYERLRDKTGIFEGQLSRECPTYWASFAETATSPQPLDDQL